MKFSNNTINYWFTSDSHFSHKNIIKGISSWNDKSECRPFENRNDHNEAIVKGINNVVKDNDVLFHLGDWSFGGIEQMWNFRKQINCKNIYLCTGNHDQHIKADKELPNVEHIFDYENTFKDIGEEQTESFNVPVKAQELFTDVQPMYEIQIHGQRMTLCHYSMRTWYYHNKGSWMLFGHSHDSLHPEGRTMDVGVDVAKRMVGEYRPFKFQELQSIMSKKEISQPDHHNQQTNA